MDPQEMVAADRGVTGMDAADRDRAAADHLSQFQWNDGGHTLAETAAKVFGTEDAHTARAVAERGDVLDEFFGPRRWVTVPADIDAPAQRSTVGVVAEARRHQQMRGVSTPDPIVEKARRIVAEHQRHPSGGLRRRAIDPEKYPDYYYR